MAFLLCEDDFLPSEQCLLAKLDVYEALERNMYEALERDVNEASEKD